jgi:hypothetical protein
MHRFSIRGNHSIGIINGVNRNGWLFLFFLINISFEMMRLYRFQFVILQERCRSSRAFRFAFMDGVFFVVKFRSYGALSSRFG